MLARPSLAYVSKTEAKLDHCGTKVMNDRLILLQMSSMQQDIGNNRVGLSVSRQIVLVHPFSTLYSVFIFGSNDSQFTIRPALEKQT